ncbi:BBSome complex member BBS4 [Lepeophtheirus salmonis]|uniref:BBSome complex member BBS4 n=1 Tax=Lepeophtheirus salmonis TaxID=72036 RepID=UPI001AE806DC|nr:Bardet-Biedl syndrome 4 protein-like [Lepeophtheirus salmonis]
MNPALETSQSTSNGQTGNLSISNTSNIKPRSKKAPELPAMERRNWLIHNHYVRKEFETCKMILTSQLEESGGNCEYAHYVNGLILRQEGKIQESLEAFRICNVINPSNPDNVKQMGKSLHLLGRHQMAIETYKQAEIRSLGVDWEIHHHLGVSYMYLKEFEVSKEELLKALTVHKNEMSYLCISRVLLLLADTKGAIQMLKESLEYFPENSELSTKLGLLYLQLGQSQMAFEQLGNALIFNPLNSDALLALGSITQSNMDWNTALSKYKVASKIIPESPSLWNNIGMCFVGKKKSIAGISCLKRASYLAPFDWKIFFNLGLVHLMMQQFASAFHFLSSSANLHPKRGQTFMLLGITLTHLKDTDNASSAYEQALLLDNKDPAIPLNFAIYHYNRGETLSSKEKLGTMEERVLKLKSQCGLNTESDILITAGKLAKLLGMELQIEIPSPETPNTCTETAPPKRIQSSKGIREAKTSARAQLIMEGKTGKVTYPVVEEGNSSSSGNGKSEI